MGYGTRRHGRKTDGLESMKTLSLSRKSDTIFGQGTIPEPSTSHIGKGVALVALAAAFVYIYARIPQIAEMTLSFYATLMPQSQPTQDPTQKLHETIIRARAGRNVHPVHCSR